MQHKVPMVALALSLFLVSFPLSALSDNFSPKNASSAPQDLETKIDKAIAIMKIVKEDVKELEKKKIIDEKGNFAQPESADSSWSENVGGNIDKMIKIMEIVKEDVSEIKKMDEQKEDRKKKIGIN